MAPFAAVALLIIIVALLVFLVWRWVAVRRTPLLAASSPASLDCYPNPSPLDAQFGTTLYIAGKATNPRAARRFFFWNTSSQVMTVRSFTFGGYHRKFGGDVTEMIQDKLMQQYGYSNVIKAGDVFSLDLENDDHVMYKGWYNGPLFIAYCLGEEKPESDYHIVGWAPMRLQDETATYKYYYDASLKKSIMAGLPKEAKDLKEQRKATEQQLDVTATFKLARNACIHWESGAAGGQARPLPTLSNDGKSQCHYLTTMRTFEPVNVRTPLCHLTVNFGNITTYLSDAGNRAQCLRNVAIIASSKIMDASADLSNFMKEPSALWPAIATSVATSLWLYMELSGIAVNVVADIVNAAVPGGGTAISIGWTVLTTGIDIVAGSGVFAMVPGIGDQLNDIAMQYANGNTIIDIAAPFLAVVGTGVAAAAGNTAQGFLNAAKATGKAAFEEAVKQAGKVVVDKGVPILVKKVPVLKGTAGNVLTLVLNTAISAGVSWGSANLSPEDVSELLEEGAKGADIGGDVKTAIDDLLSGQIKGGLAEIAFVLNDQLKERAESLAEAGLEKSTDVIMNQIVQQIMAMNSALFPEATGKGAGKERWTPGTPGKDGYALDRKLWVNRELQKGKFTKDARCTGDWKVTYHS